MSGEEPPAAGENPRRDLLEALRAVHREVMKAGVVYATLDAAILAFVVDGALTLGGVGLTPVAGAVTQATVIGLAVGFVAFWVELVYYLRQSVERFEAVNPALAPVLRTARDAFEDGADGPMARAVYRDAVSRLPSTSGTALVNTRRLAATVLGVLVASVLVAGAAGVDISIDPNLDPGGDPAGPPGTPTPDPDAGPTTGLRGSGDVLGDPEDVSSGSDPLNTTVQSTGTGSGDSLARDYDTSGLPVGQQDVDVQRAGFADQEQIEDAEIIREYNLRIRGETDE